MNDSIIYAKEYWTGDSRDGVLINGEGYHFIKMKKSGLIVAYTETLIRHYDKTLEAWLERFLSKRSVIKDLFDEKLSKVKDKIDGNIQ